MKTFAILSTCILLAGTCGADPAPPYGIDILSDIRNLDIDHDQWALANGTLTKKKPGAHADKLLIMKRGVVEVPVWYSLTCEVVDLGKRKNSLPEAGVVFAFVDNRNYWRLVIDQELAQPILRLVQVKDNKIVTDTSVPVELGPEGNAISISVEVHQEAYVKASINRSLALTHRISSKLASGRVGLTLQSGLCGFSSAHLSGIAKR